MPYFADQMPSLAEAIAGGARYAQAMREAEAFKLQKEDRAYEREQAQRKQDFEMRVRAAIAKVPPKATSTPEERSAAIDQVAVLSPDAAAKLVSMDQDSVKLAEDQFALQNKKALDQAVQLKQAVAAFEEAPNEFNLAFQAKRLAAQGAPPELVQNFAESLRTPGGSREFLSGVDDTIARLSKPEKPAAPYDFDALAKKAGTYLGSWEGNPALANPQVGMAHPRWGEALRAALDDELKSRKAGATTVTQSMGGPSGPGTQKLAVAEQARLQAENDMVNSARGDIVYIRQLMDSPGGKNVFTWGGRFKGWGADQILQSETATALAEGLGVSKEQLGEMVRAQQEIRSTATMMSYKLLVSLSGKATTDRERELLFDAMGDPMKMSEARYRAAIDGLDSMFQNRANQTGRKLREGQDLWLSDEDRSIIDTKLADIEQRRAAAAATAKSDDELAKIEERAHKEVQQVGRVFDAMTAKARAQKGGPMSVQTSEPASATMKTPKVGGTLHWNGSEWVE